MTEPPVPGTGPARPGISRARLAHIAAWSIELPDDEAERACAGIVEKTFARGACICPKNTVLESWTGVVTGLIKIGTVSPEGRSVTFTGVPAGGWFGEGTVLKNEPRRYDIVALRDTRMAFMERPTFMWLVEHSVAFNRFLVRQLNERLSHFMALLEYDRLLDATPRLARCLASLFNPVLYPGGGDHLDITQEELGLLSGITRQVANQSLKTLQKEGLVRLEYGGITVVDLARLRCYGA
ncbi:Crp/Fnr family transcriptional regulator [Burkholderia ubonensis]|uniref:Crp/Fnr family transcriptional regulator n=1 Tax=Burkholderia ubonensis TaxID=101571 RepID=UPI000A9B5D48|nr:Crp/Fnr family transcriptional regulator [Burkholderia ubonensis]